MQPVPFVAIVGRPNVGKSTLYNALLGHRLAIVDAAEGTTRDVLVTRVREGNLLYDLADTGGITKSQGPIGQAVQNQVREAIRRADLLVLLTDLRSGLLPIDRAVAQMVREASRPCILVGSKADAPSAEAALSELYALGLGDPLAVSALHRKGLSALREQIRLVLSQLKVPPRCGDAAPEAGTGRAAFKIAIVGQRNVGKSTLVNRLLGAERMIVSEEPGTTRDAVDVECAVGDRRILLIDTAGFLRRGREQQAVDYFSRDRALEAIRRADVVLFLVEAPREISSLEKHLGRILAEAHKPALVVLNKWDLVREVDRRTGRFSKWLDIQLPGLASVPICFVSALTGENVPHLVGLAAALHAQSGRRVTTGILNDVLGRAKSWKAPPYRGAKKAKIYYAIQAGVRPPEFVLFVNDPAHFSPEYRRYLENRLRQDLPFSDVPILVRFRGRAQGRPRGTMSRQGQRGRRQ